MVETPKNPPNTPFYQWQETPVYTPITNTNSFSNSPTLFNGQKRVPRARTNSGNAPITSVSVDKAAKEFYEISDEYSGMESMKRMQKLLDTQVDADHILEFLDDYEKYKKGDTSIINTITKEFGASGTAQQKNVLTTIMAKLSQAARNAGVPAAEIQKANNDFMKAYTVEYQSWGGAFRATNSKDMEKAMDYLRGCIITRLNSSGEISSADAISSFKHIAAQDHNNAAREFNAARAQEGWAARAGDTICGWFGCNTIDDLTKKFGNNKDFVQALLNSKTEAEFRDIYKNGLTTPDGRKIQGRGVDFDPAKIEAMNNVRGDYMFALNCEQTIKTCDELLLQKNSYEVLKNMLKNRFGFDQATINKIIEEYSNGEDISSSAKKSEMLVKFIEEVKANTTAEFDAVRKGRTTAQMANQVELITKSALGEDIGKDGTQFNENMVITEMVTECAAEIAGTIALQFVPGLGQMAAARFAVSASRWGPKAVKVVNFAVKAETKLAKIQRVQQGTSKLKKTGQVISTVANAGIATETVDLSNGKSVKEATKKALMNMSFAAVGAGSSILAPKLMQTFGIADKALATEIAEEIINAAGSYGVTTLQGGEYGSTDAFIDFASGLIIARVSHAKGPRQMDVPVDEHGNAVVGGFFGNNNGDGLLSRMFSNATPHERNIAALNAQKNQQAIANGLDAAIAQGKVSPDVKTGMYAQGSKHSLNDATTGNVVSDRLVNALRLDAQGQSFVKTLRNDADISQISRYVEDGGVCYVNGSLFVNDNGTAIPIKMSKAKFERLFPPLKCATMRQDGGTYICAATSQINGMLDTPGGRARLFSMIEENADGSVIVNLTNGRQPIKFPTGRAVKLEGRFLSDAPEGVLMIEQAFMANNIRRSSVNNITDISTIPPNELLQQSTENMNRRSSNATARQIGGTNEEIYNTYDKRTGTIRDDVRENFDRMLNSFVPGQDVLLVHWDGHARQIVNYDPQAQIVTYRDPMSGGVDTQCTMIQLMHKGGHNQNGYGMYMSLQKRTPVKNLDNNLAIPRGYTESGTVTIANDTYPAATNAAGEILAFCDGEWLTHREINRLKGYDWRTQLTYTPGTPTHTPELTNNSRTPVQPVANPTETPFVRRNEPLQPEPPATQRRPTDIQDNKFVSKTTVLSRDRALVVARTAEGNPIGATITQSNVIIIKDGKRTPVPIPINGDTELVHETSTDTYLIIKNDNGKISITTSETPELPTEITSPPKRPSPTPRNNPRPQATQLAIPAGAKLYDEITIMGKTCRRIQMPNGEYLTEWNGQWRKM